MSGCGAHRRGVWRHLQHPLKRLHLWGNRVEETDNISKARGRQWRFHIIVFHQHLRPHRRLLSPRICCAAVQTGGQS